MGTPKEIASIEMARGDEASHPIIHPFTQAISIAPLQVHYYSEALPS